MNARIVLCTVLVAFLVGVATATTSSVPGHHVTSVSRHARDETDSDDDADVVEIKVGKNSQKFGTDTAIVLVFVGVVTIITLTILFLAGSAIPTNIPTCDHDMYRRRMDGRLQFHPSIGSYERRINS